MPVRVYGAPSRIHRQRILEECSAKPLEFSGMYQMMADVEEIEWCLSRGGQDGNASEDIPFVPQ